MSITKRLGAVAAALAMVVSMAVVSASPASAEPLGGDISVVGCADIANQGWQVDGVNMATYSYRAGFRSEWEIVTSVAVSRPESRWCTGASTKVLHPDRIEDSRGLMQINVTVSEGNWAYIKPICGLTTPETLWDPQANYNCAFKLYLHNGRSFGAWSAYRSGSYVAAKPMAKAGYDLARAWGRF